jgi:tRNA threonylcarbamoyladenosine biosynthesis protein TsaE
VSVVRGSEPASDVVRLQTRTENEQQTEELARRIGERVGAGTVIGLIGDLGGGKTCFVRGLATGLGLDPRSVSSPTFVYLVSYDGARLPFHHADLYRIDEGEPAAAARACESIGLYEVFGGDGVAAVEWWDRYAGPIPQNLILVEFTIESVECRAITLEFRGPALAPLARAIGVEQLR